MSEFPKFLEGDRIGREGRVLLGCASVVLNDSRDKVLLTRRADNHQWVLPGGAFEPGETVSEACIRETKEETGLDIELVRLVGVYSDLHRLLVYGDGNKYHLVTVVFEARKVNGQLTPSAETTEFSWASVTELEDYDVTPYRRHVIEDALSPEIVVR